MRRWFPNVSIRVEARPRDLRSRLSTYGLLIALMFCGLLGRLWTLQVLNGDELAELARHNHLKERDIPAPRGSIYDALGNRVAEVRASYELVLSPEDVDRMPQREVDEGSGALAGPAAAEGWELPSRTDLVTLMNRVAPLLENTNAEELTTRFEDGRKVNRFRPVVLKGDLSQQELERVMAARPWLPGIAVEARHRRSYSSGPLFGHLIGYQREVRPEDLERLSKKYAGTAQEDWYSQGDLIGKAGVEAAWEEQLRGHNGAYWVQIDVHGRELGRSKGGDLPGDDYFRSIAHFLDKAVLPEVPGHDLHLTVRQDLQELAVELLGDESGSVVMMEVDTGRVLTIANAPSIDPEIFSRPIPQELWTGLLEDPGHPLVDKALQGIYPPGSTWKMIVAAAALGTGQFTEQTRVSCPGYLKVGRRRFHCWKRSGHGSVNLEEALKGSCDVYFYRAGLAAGIDEVSRYASMFGMGEPTGVGINGEKGALNPSTDWKKRRYASKPRGGKWNPGDTASAVIGQGYTLTTPMQLASMTATLANGGVRYRPQVVDRVVAHDGRVVERGEPEVLGYLDVSQAHLQAIQRGMFAVVDSRGGTARRQRLDQLAYAGKTGTAQVVRLGASNARRFRDHAWFVAYAPYENPEVAITVLVEHGEHGSTAAAPIARKIFEKYFEDRIAAAKEAGVRIGDPGSSPGAP